jgi:hypothetical protein
MTKEKKPVIGKGISDRIKDRLDARKRTKRTLVLTVSSYEEFEKFCHAENRYPSEVIDDFISIYNEERRGKVR